MKSHLFNTSTTGLLNEIVFCRFYVSFEKDIPYLRSGENLNSDYIPSFMYQNFRRAYDLSLNDEDRDKFIDPKTNNIMFTDKLISAVTMFTSSQRRNDSSSEDLKKYLAKSAARIAFFDSKVTLYVDEARFVQAVCSYSGAIYHDNNLKLPALSVGHGVLEPSASHAGGESLRVNKPKDIAAEIEAFFISEWCADSRLYDDV